MTEARIPVTAKAHFICNMGQSVIAGANLIKFVDDYDICRNVMFNTNS